MLACYITSYLPEGSAPNRHWSAQGLGHRNHEVVEEPDQIGVAILPPRSSETDRSSLVQDWRSRRIVLPRGQVSWGSPWSNQFQIREQHILKVSWKHIYTQR